MYIKNIFLLAISFVAFGISKAQLSPIQEIFGDKQEIVFNTSGKMISFPKTFVTRSTRLIFKVSASSNFLEPWWSLLQERLKAAKQFYNSSDNRPLYDCFFTKTKIGNYDSAIDLILALDITKICDSNQFNSLISNFKKTPNPDLIPVENFLYNIINNQYEVRIYKNDNCIKTLHLTPQISCSDCIYFVDKINPDGIKIDDLQCPNCDADDFDQLQFELVRYDPFKKTIRDWFEEKAVDFNKHHNLRDAVAKAIKDDNVDDFLYNETYLRDWFMNWFWFNGGKIQLDPFEALTAKGKETLLKSISEQQSKIDDAKNEISLIDSARKKITVFTEFGNFQTERTNQKDILTAADGEKAKNQSLLKNTLFNEFNGYSILYQGFLKPSASFLKIKNRNIDPQKQFDASKKFQPVNISLFQKSKIKEIPENEHMYIAVHNIPQSVTVRIDEKRLNFDDQEEFTRLLNEQLPKFDFSSLTNFKNVQDFLSSFITNNVPSAKGLEGKADKTLKCSVPKLDNIASDLKNGFITFPPNKNLFNQLVASDPLYKTQLDPLTNFEAPFRDSITIKEIFSKDSSVDAAKTYVKVGKLRFIQLAAGIAFTQSPVSTTTIDTTGGGFKVSTSDNRAAAIFGFKIYPFKSYNRDNSLIPRYPLRRFSAFGGFEIVHPLNNFFVGGNYDIVPGLSFSYGGNLYLKTNYTLQNGAITNTSRSYKWSGGYYGVTINPTLFVQFVKLFFK